MPDMTTTIEINCPPDQVYAYVTDPTRFAEWQADVVRVEMDDPAGGAGAGFTTVRRIGGTERSIFQQISEYEPPRRWASVAIRGPIRPTAGIDVEPIDGGAASRVTFTLGFAGSGIGLALLPLVRRQAQKLAPVSYQRAKRHLERNRTSPS
jgi:uncharacterized protein YndB with AHSA1/START domain